MIGQFKFNSLKKSDPILYSLVKKEIKRQQETLSLIPSENFSTGSVLELMGSPLMNKYSEGYPHKRYYPGNIFYDEIELLAQERLLKVFKLDPKIWSVNVQSYSGSPANIAIYQALLEEGDTIMGMSLSSGGHLTHGHKVNFSGKHYKSIQYEVDDKGWLDYKKIQELALKYKPKLIISGATAYPREIDFKKIGNIVKKIRAYHLADISHIAGLISADCHVSPFSDSDIVMSTTHKTLAGPRGAIIFSKLPLSEKIDKAVFPGVQGGPHNNAIAAKANMALEIQRANFKKYQRQIVKNAKVLAESLTKQGFDLLTKGTDNHLMLIDLRKTGLSGKEAEILLEKTGILANRNSIVGDIKPYLPSGLRLGTPLLTKRGMKEKEMKLISDLIYRVLIKKESILRIRKEVLDLCKKFPIKY